MLISPPTGTVTFLFTDIEGSTRLWESDPAAMREALALHDEIVRASIEANGGYVFKTIGDAFCAAFHTAPEAVAAALDAQLSLVAEKWMVDPPVSARMALHTGAAQERSGDYFGQPMNRVARILSAGHGGQTLLSATAQELVRDALPAGCRLIDLGDAALKDLARSERVYQLDHPDLPSEFSPLRTLNSGELPNNLPQPATSFIGRGQELARVTEMLHNHRLLTLVGTGGAGKTRLALQAAAELLEGDGDGVWLVELAALADPALVLSAAARVLGVKENGSDPIQKTLVEALRHKHLLIVLDNCEHVRDACCSLATDLLRVCPGVHVLATSRAPLQAPGEQLYRVPSLSAPPSREPAESYTAESLSQYDSARLLIERAIAVQPSFAVTDANAPAVAQLCAHLDGIPLAIELAAARVRSMAVEQVNERLDQRFKLLTGGSRMNLLRHQTLKATIDWSYDLLTEQERAMLVRLSVFAGGWTLEAAEQVCVGVAMGVGQLETLDLLTSLTDNSLVNYDDAQDKATPRYHLLESIRQYGQDRMAKIEHSHAVQARERHLAWCVSLAEEAAPELRRADQAAWLSRLEAEHDNFRAALEWCEQAWTNEQTSIAALRLAGALWRFWYTHGYYSEGRQWLDKVLGGASGCAPETLSLRANVLNGGGGLAFVQGDYAASRALYQESLTARRKTGDAAGVAGSMNNLGNVAYEQGDFAASRKMYAESLEVYRRIGDKLGISTVLNNLANATYSLGEHAVARALYEESLALCREIKNTQGTATALGNLGQFATDQGDTAAACDYLRGSLTIFRESGNRSFFPRLLRKLASLASAEHQPARAIRLRGAEKTLRVLLGMPLNHHELQEHESMMVKARAALGDDSAADAAWTQGSAMSWEQAAEYALSEDD